MRRMDRLASISTAFVAALVTLTVPEVGHAQLRGIPGHIEIGRTGISPTILPNYHPETGVFQNTKLISNGPDLTRVLQLDVRGFSGGGVHIERRLVLVAGDGATGGSDWLQDFDCGESCPRIDLETLSRAYAERARRLGARAMSNRSTIHDLALGSLMLGVNPRSRPAVLRLLSSIIARARQDEESFGGSIIAIRAAFLPRGSFDITDAPQGERMLNAVKAATAKMKDPVVFIFGMASQESGTEFINTTLADLRAIAVADELRRKLGRSIEVHGVGMYALQKAGFRLDSGEVEKYFGSELLPQTPSGVQDSPDSVSNQGVIVLVVSRKGPSVVLRSFVQLVLAARG